MSKERILGSNGQVRDLKPLYLVHILSGILKTSAVDSKIFRTTYMEEIVVLLFLNEPCYTITR